MRDSLGDRMKRNYEERTRTKLPRRTHTIIRLDGKAFHTYTRGRPKPWDANLHANMGSAALELCRQAQGTVLGYVQSDEISLLLTDFATNTTDAWFDGSVQKIASVSASIVTARFNRAEYVGGFGPAYFDSRVFTIPDPVEVHNYFVWRQKDAIRNSVQAAAQAHFSPRQLDGQKVPDMLAMLEGIKEPWEAMPADFKRGTVMYRNAMGWVARPAPAFTMTPLVEAVLKGFVAKS
jgi:tRNA(His) guanylyltransferase